MTNADLPGADHAGRDELTRARRALRAADAELDLARIRALARARATAHAADPRPPLTAPNVRRDQAIEHGPRPGSMPDRLVAADPGPHVEVLLRRSGHDGGRRRARPVVWGLAAAAAVVAVGVTAGLTLGVPHLRGQGPLPGGAPAEPVAPFSALPSPGPTVLVTPAEALDRAGGATAYGACDLTTRSTLDSDSALRTDTATSTVGTPKVALADKPLGALQQVTVATALNLPEVPGQVDDEVAFAAQDARAVLRVRITPDRSLLLGGEVTRIDLFLDLESWQPRGAQVTARTDEGATYVLDSELSWEGCDGPTPSSPQG
ncbi:hypothetical protein ACFQBY_20700 [Promicromonospora citrea]|uniref:Uncharacterized protein n=1 Tax=Promicromonospora citrea TaxID=43677 RepID=A0A8H9GIR4_9MICO|nr:hypothetical protein [Promicromonospora citrea]NNH52668.1 hypothetical protein [Promicromonospora citrea]GGM31950.1 hypothetical protein GCM10010102_29220 [Promicromonospora citrea]